MILKSHTLIFAATLMAVPMATALAQQNNPTGNMGVNRSATASPGTADNKAVSGMNSADSGARNSGTTGAAMNSTTPGATGSTVVPGTTSSQAGAAAGTVEQKSGAVGGSSK